LSLNDEILKDADKLSRYSKDFSRIWPLWGDGSAAEDLYGELANGVKNWFFLADAKKMVRMALDHLMQHDQTQTQRQKTMGIDG
jgi:hypothetical protein